MRSFLFYTLLFLEFTAWGQCVEKEVAVCPIITDDGIVISKKVQKYSIQNNADINMYLFFTEDSMEDADTLSLIRKKTNRRYGDFHLSLLAWKPNMVIDSMCKFSPSLFVKVIRPKKTFDIFLDVTEEQESSKVDFLQHLLICDEKQLSDKRVGLMHFYDGLIQNHFEYPFSFILLNSKDLRFRNGSK